MISRIVLVGLVAASVGAADRPAAPADAPRSDAAQEQPTPPPAELPRDWEQAELAELIETVKVVRLSRELGLNNEQTVVLVREYEEARDRLEELRRQRQEALKQLKDAIKAGEDDTSVDEKLKTTLKVDREMANLRFDLVQRAYQNLSPTQTAKLYVFLSEFEGDMRRLLQRAREQGPGLMRLRERLEHEGGPAGPMRFRHGLQDAVPPPPPPGDRPAPGAPAAPAE